MGFRLEDWDQKVFAWIWRAIRRPRFDTPLAHVARLDEARDRLGLVGSMLVGRPIELLPADGPAGVRGDAILLPESIGCSESLEGNRELYLLTLVVQATVCRFGFSQGEVESPGWARTWLAMSVCAEWLAHELPGVGLLLSNREEDLLRGRPDPSMLEGADLVLEVALRQVLVNRVERPNVADRYRPRLTAAQLAWLRHLWESAGAILREGDATPFDEASVALQISLDAMGTPAAVVPCLAFGRLRPRRRLEQKAGEAPLQAPVLPSPTTERPGKSREEVRRVELNKEQLADNPLVHSFEKVHTAEQYQGGQKSLDGSDELDDHLQALEELDLREVIRSSERTHSLLRADALLEGSAPELRDETAKKIPDFVYDEWDGKKRTYLRGYCSLYTRRARPTRNTLAARWVDDLRRKEGKELRRLEALLAKLLHERRPMPRQRDGEAIDLDAAVDSLTTRSAGHTPSDRVYIRTRKHDPELALLLLLDISLSSDAYLREERVLDVARETAWLVGEALSKVDLRYAMAAFHSHTRNDCRFLSIKGFAEPWSGAPGRLLGLQPTGYTRIGPALRHGVRSLKKVEARRRAMIVLTDAQPTDYDRYEGRHGTHDVAQAVREARSDGVAAFALAIADRHRTQLGEMFGLNRYALLPTRAHLGQAVERLLPALLHTS